jgi:hypothetical protein
MSRRRFGRVSVHRKFTDITTCLYHYVALRSRMSIRFARDWVRSSEMRALMMETGRQSETCIRLGRVATPRFWWWPCCPNSDDAVQMQSHFQCCTGRSDLCTELWPKQTIDGAGLGPGIRWVFLQSVIAATGAVSQYRAVSPR